MQHNKGESGVPKPALWILGYFVLCRIYTMIYNPYIFYPVLIIVPTLAFLWRANLLDEYMPQVLKVVNQGLIAIGTDFRV